MLSVAKEIVEGGYQNRDRHHGAAGCMAVQGDEIIRVYRRRKSRRWMVQAPGATFSSGFIYGHLKGWGLEGTTRFAIAAASSQGDALGFEDVFHQGDQGARGDPARGAHGISR